MPTLQLALIALLLVACGAAIAQHRWPFVGWLLSTLLGASLHLLAPTVEPLLPAPDLAYFAGLPPLLFASAWQLNGRLARTQLSLVLLLATVGVALSSAAIASAVAYLSPLALTDGLWLGAALAAISPGFIRPLLLASGVPRYLSALLTAEGALSQLVAAAGFSAIATLITPDRPELTAWPLLVRTLATTGLGGMLIGVGSGLLLYSGLRAAKQQPYIQVTLSLAVVWLVFGLAASLQVSGAIAVVLLGLVTSWLATAGLSPSNRELLAQLWAYLDYSIGALACLFAGWAAAAQFQSLDAGLTFVWLLLLVVGAGAIARLLATYLLVPLVNSLRQVTPLDWRVQTLLWAGGTRSPVALVLLLSLESVGEPSRNLLLAVALAVLLLTTALSRASLGNLARYLELTPPSLAARVERLQAQLTAKREALRQFSDLERFKPWTGTVVDAIAQDYTEAIYHTEQSLTSIWVDRRLPAYDLRQVLWLQALSIEMMGYRYLYDRGLLSEPVLAKLELRVTLRRDAVLLDFMPPPFFTLRTQSWQLGLAQWLRASRWERRARQQATLTKYEADAAIACVCAQVAQTLQRSIEDKTIGAAIAQECAAAYREDSQVANRNLAAAASQDPAQVSRHQRQIVQRVAALGEQDALEQLVRDGTLSADLARALRTWTF